MQHLRTLLTATLLFSLTAATPACADDHRSPDTPSTDADNPRVILDTTMGPITVELFEQQAPVTVANFLAYVDDGFYTGIQFHRVIGNFMVQTGGYDADLAYREPRGPIANEASNGLTNERGTLAMARLSDPDSADSQFFINLKHNGHLDYSKRLNPGYAVFGRVVEGMEVVDAIADVDTGTKQGMANVPLEPVLITAARRADG